MYQTYSDYQDMRVLTQEIMQEAAIAAFGETGKAGQKNSAASPSACILSCSHRALKDDGEDRNPCR
jgi:lysyl-tRNA synthetase class II